MCFVVAYVYLDNMGNHVERVWLREQEQIQTQINSSLISTYTSHIYSFYLCSIIIIIIIITHFESDTHTHTTIYFIFFP